MKKNGPVTLLLKKEYRKAWTIVQFTSAFMLLFVLSAHSSALQSRSVSLNLRNVTFFQVFDEIHRQTGLRFVYNTDQLRSQKTVDVQAENKDVEEVFTDILRGTNLTFVLEDDVVMLVPQQNTQRQGEPTRIAGTVTDVNGQPLPGVTVRLVYKSATEDKFIGVSTDVQGRYVITVPADATNPVFYFSFVGMKNQIVPVTGKEAVNVVMEEAQQEVGEVVVTGYQQIDRRHLTSAVTSMKMSDIEIPGVLSIDKALEGNVPGLIFMQSTGQVGAAPKLRIRGSSSILGNQEPLWVVDGIIVQDKVNIDPVQLNDLDFVNLLGNAISGLNPADIEQIDVLKDAAATALYGARAANGVIVVTTKKGQAGPPKISYSMSGTFTPRPRYTDRAFHMMNSKERIDVSRELMERDVRYSGYYPGVDDWVGYERAYLDYFQEGTIDFNEFSRRSKYYETMNTDWLKLLTKDVFSHNHTVSLNGGSENIRYYASVGFADQKGNVRGEKNDRYTATLKTTLNYDKLTAEFGVIGDITEKRYSPTELNVMSYAHSMNRALPLYGEDGELWYYNRGPSEKFPFNIRNEMDHSSWDINQYGVNLTGQVRYKFNDRFSLRGVASYQFSYTDDSEWFGEESWHVKSLNLRTTNAAYPYFNYLCPFGGELKQSTTRNNAYTFRLQADYNTWLDADNKHFINAMAGYELSSSKYNSENSLQRGYFKDRGQTVAPPPIYTLGPNVNFSHYQMYYHWLINNHPTYTESLTNMLSAYATFTYSYADRYILNVNGRADWSNAFGSRSNEKLFPVWSVSGRWNISDEKFMQNASWVDNLALRLSYGLQGNMLNNQPSRLVIQKNPLGVTGDEYANIVHYANPDLRWEKTNSYNAGIDFSLFNNKVRGSFAYYYKKTTDAFLDRRVGSQNGVTTYTVNAGDIENHGVEIALSFTPIDQGIVNGKRGFVWRFDPQIGQAVNQLVNRAINRHNDYLQDDLTFMDMINGAAYIPGTALNTFYSFRYKALDNTGRPTFYGLEADRVDELNEKYAELAALDKKNVWMELLSESGTRVPVLQGSLRNYVAYRNFSLSVNLTYSLGNKIRMFKLCSSDYSAVNPYPHNNLRKEFVDRWRGPGDEKHTDIPGIATEVVGAGDQEKIMASYGWWYNKTNWAPDVMTNRSLSKYSMYDYSDLRVVSGDYLRMQSLVFTYTLGDKFLQNLGIANASVSLSGQNLFTICDKKLKGQNPEQFTTDDMISIALRPQYTFSLNLNF